MNSLFCAAIGRFLETAQARIQAIEDLEKRARARFEDLKKMYGEFDATQPEAFFACLADFLVDFEQARRDNEESRARAKQRKLNKAKAEAQRRKLELRKKEREKAKSRQKQREDAEDAEDAAAGKEPRRRRRSSIHRAPKPAPSAMAAMIKLL